MDPDPVANRTQPASLTGSCVAWCEPGYCRDGKRSSCQTTTGGAKRDGRARTQSCSGKEGGRRGAKKGRGTNKDDQTSNPRKDKDNREGDKYSSKWVCGWRHTTRYQHEQHSKREYFDTEDNERDRKRTKFERGQRTHLKHSLVTPGQRSARTMNLGNFDQLSDLQRGDCRTRQDNLGSKLYKYRSRMSNSTAIPSSIFDGRKPYRHRASIGQRAK